MIYKSIKISLKNLWNNKHVSIINVAGLAIGLTTAILIFLWIYEEINFDKFNKNYKDIYMVATEWKYPDGKSDFIMETPAPLGPFLKENFPEIIHYTRFEKQFGGRFLKFNNKKLLENGLAIEPSFFNVFTVSFIAGDAKTCLNDPNSILISEKLAYKFFKAENPIGKTITLFQDSENKVDYQIKGIYQNIPENSSLQFDFLIPINLEHDNNWFIFGTSTFLLLSKKVDVKELNSKISQFYADQKITFDIQWYLHPLKDFHFHSDFQLFIYHPGNKQYVYIYSIAGVFVLFIAFVNFISLIAVFLSNRVKETGIKKMAGASIRSLIVSFLFEPLFLIVTSLLLAFILVESAIPIFGEIFNKQIPSLYHNLPLLIILILIILILGIISGVFPGLYISSINAIDAIYRRTAINKRNFRKYFLVLQFTLSIMLLCSTIIIHKQLHFIYKKDLGFQKENILHIPLKGNMDEKYSLLKNEILKNPGIINITNNSPVMKDGVEVPGWDWEGNNDEKKRSVAFINADYDFIKTFKIKVVKGNYFSEGKTNANDCVIINEEAAKVMGMQDPIHKQVHFRNKDYTIIGVVKDFYSCHFSSKIRPLLIFFTENSGDLYIEFNSGNKNDIIEFLNKTYQKHDPDFPFGYHFLTDEIHALYNDEQHMLRLFNYFTIITLLILCFGLFGLSKQVAISMTKEIGIRKTNGAKTWQIILMLSKDFTKWVLLAFIIACPIAYFIMNKWLQNFAYRTNLSWWVFVASGAVAFAVSLLTVSWQSWRAASRNPVEALRYE